MRTWFSPHGTEWEAETYEEALEQERDALVEQLEALDLDNARLRNALRRIADAPWKSATVTGDIARNALDRAANPYPASGEAGVPASSVIPGPAENAAPSLFDTKP